MKVKPVAGRQVPDPYLGDHLPPEGRTVERNQYWMRRVEDGDVVEVTESVAAEEQSKPQARTKESTNETR